MHLPAVFFPWKCLIPEWESAFQIQSGSDCFYLCFNCCLWNIYDLIWQFQNIPLRAAFFKPRKCFNPQRDSALQITSGSDCFYLCLNCCLGNIYGSFCKMSLGVDFFPLKMFCCADGWIGWMNGSQFGPLFIFSFKIY